MFHNSYSYATVIGADPEILKRGGALCWPPELAGENNFKFQMAEITQKL